MSPKGAENNRKCFFEGHFLWSFFEQVKENWGKNPSHPQNVPAPTPMCCTTTDLGIFLF